MISHLFQERYPGRAAASVFFVLWIVCGSLLVGCGGSPSLSGSYAYTDSTQVELLSWKEGNGNGQILGQWNGVSYQPPLSGKSQPSVSPAVSLTGTENDQTIQLTGNALSFNGALSGNTLKIRATTPSGQLVDQTWMPATQQEYNDLVKVFKTYMQLQGTITDLSNAAKQPPDDSNPSSLNYALQQTQQYITMLKTKVTNLQNAPTHADQCQQADTLSQYWPAAPETFQLPYEPGKSTLARDLATIQSLWKQGQNQKVHVIAGLNPPWLLSQGTLNTDLKPGQQAYTSLQNTYQQDHQQMLQLRDTDYQQLSTTITSIKQGCP